MGLVIYKKRSDIPSNMQFINYNDKYFNGTSLKNNEIDRLILSEVDGAQYSSENTFIGRDKSLGNINKEHLSTGCKTLLNIVNNTNKCFDIIECGQNAISLLRFIKEGNVLWENPVLHFVGDSSCDINIEGRHFTNFRDFLSYIMD